MGDNGIIKERAIHNINQKVYQENLDRILKAEKENTVYRLYRVFETKTNKTREAVLQHKSKLEVIYRKQTLESTVGGNYEIDEIKGDE